VEAHLRETCTASNQVKKVLCESVPVASLDQHG